LKARNNEVAIVIVNTELRHARQNVAHIPRYSIRYTTIDATDTNNQESFLSAEKSNAQVNK